MTQPGPNSDAFNDIDALLEGAPPAAAAAVLAGLLNRASARLHTLARGQANARKGQAEWPAWAQLQNAARALVLQASTCRDLAARLPGDAAAEPNAPLAESEPPATEPPHGEPADQPRPGTPPADSSRP